MSSDGEFTIRVTGAAPPPLPTAKKGKRGGGRGKGSKSAAPPPQAQRRYNLRLRPSSSLEEMRKDVFALFDVPSDSIGAYQVSFLGGFPPKELEQAGKGSVHELGIRPNESLIVKFALAEGSSADVAAASEAAASKSDPGAASGTGRQKRASAMAATASFKEVIAAQDEMMKQGKQGKPSPKKRGASTSANRNVSGFGAAGRGNGGNAAAASKKPKKAKMEGAGYRLSDGKSFAGSSPPKKSAGGNKRVKALFQGHRDVAQGEEDIANKVLSSLAGGSKGGNVGSFLRSAMKGALEKSYEASRARVRVTAVDQGEFTFEKASNESVDSAGVVLGAAGQQLGLYTVSYSKGMEGRGRYEEQVKIYGAVAVKGVLQSVYNTAKDSGDRETADVPAGDQDGRLRPDLIAQLSPRIFWSLVFHCSQAAKSVNNPAPMPTSVNEMLRATLPELDWSHLDRGGRKRVLSEKARENLRQLKDEETADSAASGAVQEGEDGAKAAEEMEESLLNANAANGEAQQGLSERERRARAAMARFGGVNDERKPPASSAASPKKEVKVDDDWQLVTPTEDDVDELIECIKEGSEVTDEAAKVWAAALLFSVRNWRELANSNPKRVLSILDGGSSGPTNEVVQKWIDAAQSRALAEIMLEILDNDQDALEALKEKAFSGCPKDLIKWQALPVMLLDAVSAGDTSGKWEESDVVRWITRAKTALGACPWLELYTS
ncbi:hypothetical protein ACHAXT_000433 [Thalassiosira profunda]